MPDLLRIMTTNNLSDLERLANGIDRQQPDDPVNIWLPRNIGPQFFKDCRIVSILATGARKGRLVVTDWYKESKKNEVSERFLSKIEGMAAVTFSEFLQNAKKQRLPVSAEELRNNVIHSLGILEPPSSRGTSLTFCALDSAAPTPLMFAGADTKDKFVSIFRNQRKQYLEVGVGEDYARKVDPEADRNLAGFVYELLQNSFEHGRYDKNGDIIPGFRYVRLRKHIEYNKQKFVDRARGFEVLQEYLDEIVPSSGQFKFYEVTVSDHGLGIIDRFLATRPEFAPSNDATDQRLDLLNRIITEALSSKRNLAGAGYGLQRALAAAKQLRAFVTLRTERLWLYRAFSGRDVDAIQLGLRPVSAVAHLAPMAGTQFNMLIPMG